MVVGGGTVVCCHAPALTIRPITVQNWEPKSMKWGGFDDSSVPSMLNLQLLTA